MEEMVPLERGKSLRQRDGQIDALLQRQRLLAFYDACESLWTIGFNWNLNTSELVVREIHHSIEAPLRLGERPHPDKPFLLWNRAIELRAAQLARIAFGIDCIASADLHRRGFAVRGKGEIDHAIRAVADLPFKPPAPAGWRL